MLPKGSVLTRWKSVFIENIAKDHDEFFACLYFSVFPHLIWINQSDRKALLVGLQGWNWHNNRVVVSVFYSKIIWGRNKTKTFFAVQNTARSLALVGAENLIRHFYATNARWSNIDNHPRSFRGYYSLDATQRGFSRVLRCCDSSPRISTATIPVIVRAMLKAQAICSYQCQGPSIGAGLVMFTVG